jgi:Icc-related predicted phosphoesterase
MIVSRDPVTVGVAGDWHGNIRWARHALAEFRKAGVSELWHLGDFGLWPGGGRYLDEVEAACERSGITILVTPGNHEDYSRIPAGQDVTVREHIVFLKRGHRFTINGWDVVSFGGAPSIDFEFRAEGTSWWPAELPTGDEVDAAVKDGKCDILLVHDSSDAPYVTGPVDRILQSNDAGWSDRGLAYASVGRERITRLRAGLRPSLALHGHYHVSGTASHADGSRTVSLAADGTDGNLGLLSLPGKDQGAGRQQNGQPEFAFLADTGAIGRRP